MYINASFLFQPPYVWWSVGIGLVAVKILGACAFCLSAKAGEARRKVVP